MIPIIITCYNRLDTLKKTMDSLFECDGIGDREIMAYSDGGKNKEDCQRVDGVRQYLTDNKINWCGNNQNVGLKRNSLEAIRDGLADSDKIIFIQDDMQFSEDFLIYMDWALKKFEDRQDIMFVSGYSHISYPNCYLSPLIEDSLGIWKDKFNLFPYPIPDYKRFAEHTTDSFASNLKNIIDGKSDAFMALLCFRMYLNNARCLHPGNNKLRYLVSDSTNCKKKNSKKLNNNLYDGFVKQIDESKDAYNIIKETKNYKWSKFKHFTRWLTGKLLTVT